LYLVEVTKSLVRSGRGTASGGETTVDPARGTVPASLHDSLMSRLDRLGATLGQE
jgi:hypothetical protein